MAAPMVETGSYKNLSGAATTTIRTGSGKLLGVFVASTTSGTLKFLDGVGTIVNTFTPAAATWYPLPFDFGTSLIVTSANTIDFTVSWLPDGVA